MQDTHGTRKTEKMTKKNPREKHMEFGNFAKTQEFWFAQVVNSLILKPIFHCDAKPFALGPGVGLDPQRHTFALGIPTCWYLKTLKFAFLPTPNLKIALPPTPTPNASQWYIGCIGSPTQISRVGHVHFFFFLCRFHSRWLLFFCVFFKVDKSANSVLCM